MNTRRIMPHDLDKFHAYIVSTDDCQKEKDSTGFTRYPLDANGRVDFTKKDGLELVINQPYCRRWDWTDAESKHWSQFRSEYEALYKKYETADQTGKAELKVQLEKIIGSCMDYAGDQKLLQRVAESYNTPMAHFRLFNVKQDVLEIKTPHRTIRILHDKDTPFTGKENKLIKKYTALNEFTFQAVERIKKLQADIQVIHSALPDLWKQLTVLKEKADKVTNRIFLPPPSMKGAFSEAISITMPTPEENRRRMDDYNVHIARFQEEVAAHCRHCDKLFREIEWAGSLLNDRTESEYNDLHRETDELQSGLYDGSIGSMEGLAFADEYQDFLSSLSGISEQEEIASQAWDLFIEEQNIFIALYNSLVSYLNDMMSEEKDEEETDNLFEERSIDEDSGDLHQEIIQRYESGLELNADNYYDITEWHIIMDHYQFKFDNSKKSHALSRAMAQHPDEPTLLLRRAQDYAGEHDYRQALELVRQAEAQGPPHHPNLYYVKARVYCQLQTPELAIPIYKYLAGQKEKELEWWRNQSCQNLLEIYEKQKKYDECLSLCRELFAEDANNEMYMNNLALYYCLNKQPEAAVKPLLTFLKKHPESAVCRERLGLVYFDMKEYDQAIKEFDLAFAVDKDEYYSALFYKGNALSELKNFQDAVVSFEKCLLYHGLNKECHLNAAKCYNQLNLPQLAIPHYRKALSIDSDCKEALDALLQLQKQQ